MSRDDPAAFAPPPAFGPFRVLHQIGIGALGPVYRTYEPTRDRLVAVKVFRLDITPEQAQVLAEELSRAAHAGLFHPSIVEPIAAGVEGTVAYRAEEYVAAESLDVAMRHYAPAALDLALPFLTQIAGAIDFARTAGVGHGALHLRDVFVTPDEARASGFGVVEALERVGLRAPVRRPYSAPERIAGKVWSTPADVFSLGAIAYELLTGRRPSGTGDQIGTLAAENAGVHADSMRAVLARAMHEEASERYQTALAFVSALEAAARGTTAGIAGSAGLQPTALKARDGDPAPAAKEVRAVAAPLVEGPQPADEPIEQDDIAAERDEDAAHHDLLRQEVDEEPGPTLFDDEAMSDLALEEPDPAREFNFADLDDASAASVGPVAWDEGEDAVGTARHASEPGERSAYRRARPIAGLEEDPHGVFHERRPLIVPLVLTLFIGLLLGFAAGFVMGGRDRITDARTAAADEELPDSSAQRSRAQPPESGNAQPDRSGRAWSEQAVAQPSATPPPIPPEALPSAPPGARDLVATTGRMVVTSTPSGAGVTVNGGWRGRTPLSISGLRFGAYTVRIVQPGFAVASEEVKLSTAEPSRVLSFRLRRPATSQSSPTASAAPPARPVTPRPSPAPSAAAPARYVGSIYVDSRPRGARVVLDGRPVAKTPARIPDVPIGSHVVRLELADHRTWTISTRVAAGKETSVTGSLDPVR
jgi:hypothetical protein